MTSCNPFTIEVFNSFDRLQHFLKGKEALQQIREQRYKHVPATKPSQNSFLWDYVPDLFIKIYATSVKTLGYLVYFFASYELGAKLIIHSRHVQIVDSINTAPREFAKRILVRTRNLPKQHALDLLAHPFIDASQLKDKRMQKIVSSDILFVSETGICYGSCEWFAYLYFKTKHLFSDPEKHLVAIAKLFQSGAPREAIVLQNLQKNLDETPALGTSKRIVHTIQNKGTILEKTNALVKTLLAAPKGFYTLATATHAQNWIKIDNKTSYLFDPNIGLVKCNTKYEHKLMSAIISIAYSRKDPVLLRLKEVSERYFPRSWGAA